jgi:type VI secretion system secreted protein Hcp
MLPRNRHRQQGRAFMSKSKASVLVAVLLMTIGCNATLHAALDIFLDIPEIPGESVDSVHTNQVDVLAWAWGMSNSGTTHLGTNAGAGKVSFQNLNLTKYVDKASPRLMLHCANGDHLTNVTLYVRKVTVNPIEYIKIELTDVLVAGVSTGGYEGEDRLTENVALNFANVKSKYVPTKSDGSADTAFLFSWDIPGNFGTVISPVAGLTSTLIYTNGSPVATLTWFSNFGVNYQVWATSDLNSPFQPYGGSIASAGNDTTSVTVRANAIKKFFWIETLSGQ